jgi:ATP:ADP antiporter, AAA family
VLVANKREGLKATLMGLYFFLVISVFWLIKPIKKTLLTTYYSAENPFVFFGSSFDGGETEQLAKVLNMVIALCASLAFTMLYRRFRGQNLVSVIGVFFIVCLMGYAVGIVPRNEFSIWSFYLFGDLWNTMMVATFFAFLSDITVIEEAKRIYGFIGLGGVIGGMIGSSTSGFLLKSLGVTPLLLIAAVLATLIVLVSQYVGRNLDSQHSKAQATAPEKKKHVPLLHGVQLVFNSKYLLAILAMVGLYEVVSTIMDFQFTQGILSHARAEGWDQATTGAFFGKIFGLTNFVALGIQLFLTGLILRKGGVTVALMVLPFIAMFSSMGFLAVPVLLTASTLSVVDNGFNYSINQSARESLYLPLEESEKYCAKGFIDMFVQRAAKAFAVLINLTIPALVGTGITGIRSLSIVTIVLLGIWLALALFAGREFDRRSRRVVKA